MEKTFGHAPGPWTTPDWTNGDGRRVVMMAAGGSHSHIAVTSNDRPAEECRANAHLIAKAWLIPEMVEALENIKANLSGRDNREERWADSLRRATAILAKAEGRES